MRSHDIWNIALHAVLDCCDSESSHDLNCIRIGRSTTPHQQCFKPCSNQHITIAVVNCSWLVIIPAKHVSQAGLSCCSSLEGVVWEYVLGNVAGMSTL